MMRAKLEVRAVEQDLDSQQRITMSAVTGDTTYGPNGENEDNTFARFTPQGEFSAVITNPNLFGKFRVGQKFYVDFTEVPPVMAENDATGAPA